MTAYIKSLQPIIHNYDALILDLWGTVHNGAQPLPGVVEALQQLKNLNKKVIMLSNAPRRIDLIESQLKEMNITPDLYLAVHSSGEETYLYLRDEAKLGQKFYHQGMHPHQSVYRDLRNYQRVETIDEADFILATGVAHIEDKIESVIPILNQGLSRKLPLVCANPDREVLHGDQRVICPGAFADYYQAKGGRVEIRGKPYAQVYERCLKLLPGIAPNRILAAGDSLEHDIEGGNKQGFGTLWVLSGIHAPPQAEIEAYLAKHKARPIYTSSGLIW